MPDQPTNPSLAGHPLATDPNSMRRHFGGEAGLVSLWIAEPYLPPAPGIVAVLEDRAATGWYGYETRPDGILEAFWGWMSHRHGWDGATLTTSISPSVGTSVGACIELLTGPGDAVILQPPVFTDFKPLINAAGRQPLRTPLVETDDGYRMDLEALERAAASPDASLMILCNPHNPVGRAWTPAELADVAAICARHGVFVLSDEIHADLTLPPACFTPFETVASAHGTRWAATHGPIKTFGLAGVCDTLLITDDDGLTGRFRGLSSRLHLTRNNVFGMAAFRAAYETGGAWLDDLLGLIAAHRRLLMERLPTGIRLHPGEATYLAWLDLRDLGMDVPSLADWLASSAGLALSPGHWFGREGAGFARMTVAAPTDRIIEAADRLTAAVTSAGN